MAKNKNNSEQIKQALNNVPEVKQKKESKKDKIAELTKLIKDEYGIEVEPIKNTSFRIRKAIEYINDHYDFRYNIINKETEYKKKSDKEYKYFEDFDFRDLATELDLNNLGIAENKFRNLIYGSSISERFNPFMDYFNKIGKCESEFEYSGPANERVFKKVKTGKDYIKEYCEQVRLNKNRILKSFISKSDLEIYLDNVEDLPFSGQIYINDELIKYSLEKESSKIIALERGYSETKASSHSAGDYVYTKEEKENRKYFVEGFRKWFTALVVSLVVDIPHKHYINQVCLVLFGGQGKMKSTWLENLVPLHMRMKYVYTSHFDPKQRDHMLFLATHILIILEEMAALNRTDIETFKGVMTETKFAGRLSYDKEKTYLKRRGSFAATQNNKEFMKDESGSRRWFIIEVESINIQKDFPVDKMYAQALQHYKDKLKYWFDHTDIAIQESKNEEFQLRTFEYELIQKLYSVPTEDDIKNDSQLVKYLSSTDIAVALSKDNNINVNNTVKANIGKALKALKFEQKTRRLNDKFPKLWCVKEALNTSSKPIDNDINNDISNIF